MQLNSHPLLAYVLAILMMVLLTANNVEGKNKGPQIRTRGCALYGHSCFGGHGRKRSMSDDSSVVASQLDSQNPLKVVLQARAQNQEIPANYDNNIDDFDNEESAPEQDFKIAVYGLFKQWMDDLRRARNVETRNLRAYEFLKQNSGAVDQSTGMSNN